MTDVAGEDSPEKKSGCYILGAVFGQRSFWSRRATSTESLPGMSNKNVEQQNGREVPKEAIGISGELENVIAEHQKSRGGGNLVRASSSNVMLFGNLGNLGGASGVGEYSVSNKATDHLPKPVRESAPPNPSANSVGNFTPDGMSKANPLKKTSETGSLCRALSTRMDPEQLLIMGNEDYKNGRFSEALALYDAAISIDPNKASYRSTKSAALNALGHILEAVLECREAQDRAATRQCTITSMPDPEIASKTKNLQTHLSKCTEAKKVRDWNTLIKETRLALAAGADSAPIYLQLQAEAHLKLRRHQDADEALARGPDLDVDACTKFLGPIGNANLLVIRLIWGRLEASMKDYEILQKEAPEDEEVQLKMEKQRGGEDTDT
uniref:Uncharacterized protein n=1 Tax=Kalanchoe fedtschenkoi TaxID=63787 RepID=A0A7N0T750_KALFE